MGSYVENKAKVPCNRVKQSTDLKQLKKFAFLVKYSNSYVVCPTLPTSDSRQPINSPLETTGNSLMKVFIIRKEQSFYIPHISPSQTSK